ncbi:MAG: fibronectin type III domain-containing protein, partial [Synechococcus sp. SB0675_bin_7]|nr:fibronectin type III domain-containing protein [Synechococcus sp. SB0675_bin_7]
PILTATGLEGGATGSRTGDGEITLSDDDTPPPAKPTGFSATAGNTQVTLSWSNPSNSDITGWQYLQKAGGGSYGSWQNISGSTASTTSHTVIGLSNRTTYAFRIRAVAGTVNGAQSDEVTATPFAPPSKPTGFSATAGNAQVTLNWSNPGNSDISGWQVQQKEGTGSYGSWQNISGSTASTTSHTVIGLSNRTTYAFRIRAVAGTVNGAQSDEVTATPFAPPSKPTGFTAKAGNRQVSLSWEDPGNSDITEWQYRQKVGTGSYGSWTTIPSSSATSTSHTVTSLANDTVHAFRIRAVAGTVNGAQSDEVTSTPSARPPAKPTGFTATMGNKQVTLSWNNPDNSDITGYQLQRRVGTGSSYGAAWRSISGSGASTTSHTVTGLSNNIVYAFRIRAVAGNVDGVPSDGVVVRPLAPPPAKPTGFTATAGNALAGLSWDDPGNNDITGWQVQQKEGSGSYGRWTFMGGGKATSHTVSDLTNGRVYTFRIRAHAGIVNGVPSDETTATLPAVAPAKPTGFTATAGNKQVTLSWSNPGNRDIITRYQVQQKAGGGSYGSWTNIGGSGAATVSHTVTGLANGTVYAFRIRAVAGTLTGDQSDEATATPQNVTVPAKPTDFTATAGNGAVSLTWSSPGNSAITGYQYRRKAGGGSYGSWTNISGSGATTVSHTVTGLINGTAYTFRIRAVAGTVHGVPSDEATATLPPAAPAKPTGFTATAGNGAVSLAWSDPGNSAITGYQYRQKAGGGSYSDWTAISGSGAATTSHTVSGLTDGTAYTFRIRAVAGTVHGVPSDEATATLPPAAPAKPTGFTATAGNGAVSLAWSDPGNSAITGYQYRQKAGGGSYSDWTAISGSGAATTSHTVSGLTNGTAYAFRIRAVAGTVNGAQSDEATATPLAAAPAKPTGFTATAGNGAV